MKKAWKEVEKKFLEELSWEKREWVRKRVKLALEHEVTLFPREELITMFPKWIKLGGKKQLSLNDSGLLRTFVWQIGMKIKAKEYKPIGGNMRTGWYRHVEPLYIEKNLLESDVELPRDVLSLLMPSVLKDVLEVELFGVSEGMRCLRNAFAMGAEGYKGLGKKEREVYKRIERAAREQYIINEMTGVFDGFVRAGIFRFKDDFGFADPRESFRIIGKNRPRVIFFTEKEGLWWLCEYLSKKYKITVVASRGESSLLALEFLVDLLKKKKVKSVVVGALTDYDPWGFLIAVNFAKKLAEDIFFGKDNVHLTKLNGTQNDLTKLFAPGEIERGKRDLLLYSQYKQTQVKEWMKETGGIGGEPYGIHVDLARPERLKAVVEGWIKDTA